MKKKKDINYYKSLFGGFFNMILLISLIVSFFVSLSMAMNHIRGVLTLDYISNIDLLKSVCISLGWFIMLVAFINGINWCWSFTLGGTSFCDLFNKATHKIFKITREKLTLAEWIIYILILIIIVMGYLSIYYWIKLMM